MDVTKGNVMLNVGASEQIGCAAVPARAMVIVIQTRRTKNKKKNGCGSMS